MSRAGDVERTDLVDLSAPGGSKEADRQSQRSARTTKTTSGNRGAMAKSKEDGDAYDIETPTVVIRYSLPIWMRAAVQLLNSKKKGITRKTVKKGAKAAKTATARKAAAAKKT